MTGMALIDATARFAQRREAARKDNGEFGEQQRSLPELTLVADPDPAPQTLEDIFKEMDEMGELSGDDQLDAPIIDRYTGTPEEQEANERRVEYFDLLRRASLDDEAISEETRGEIYDGITRKQADRKRHEDWKRRQLPEVTGTRLPGPRSHEDLKVQQAVLSVIAARGENLSDLHQDSVDYLLEWAGEQQRNGNLAEAARLEVERSAEDLATSIRESAEAQEAHLGLLTAEVWDDALEEDRLRAQQKIRSLRPTKRVSLKETNGLIRNDLKEAFPGVKFSVRGNSYSGGASTDISYVDGPPLSDAEPVAKAYAGATFDGMTDMKDYVYNAGFDTDGVPQSVSYGPDFVFVQREFSEETTRDATARAISAFQAAGIEFDPNGRDRFQDNIPQELLRNESLNRAQWQGYGMTSHEIIRTLAEELANEKWAAKTARTEA